MTESVELEELFDVSVALSAVAHQTSLARTADQLRWESFGALQNIDREILPANAIDLYEDDGIRREHPDIKSPAVQDRFARVEHHRGIIWLSLASITNAAGNISKLLWGKNDRTRSQLRRQLSQPDDWRTAILGERSFRNHFEHHDERLFTFLGEQRDMLRGAPGSGRSLSSRIIAPESVRTEHGRLTSLARSVFGWWAPDVDKLWFLDDELDLGQLLREVINIGDLANSKQKAIFAPFGARPVRESTSLGDRE